MSPISTDLQRFLPLKPLVFEVLLVLSGEARHGWSLVREVQERLGGERILPGNFYRTLRRMLADGLIAEAENPGLPGSDPRRRYFQVTARGRQLARLEARRLEALVTEARDKRLLRAR